MTWTDIFWTLGVVYLAQKLYYFMATLKLLQNKKSGIPKSLENPRSPFVLLLNAIIFPWFFIGHFSPEKLWFILMSAAFCISIVAHYMQHPKSLKIAVWSSIINMTIASYLLSNYFFQ